MYASGALYMEEENKKNPKIHVSPKVTNNVNDVNAFLVISCCFDYKNVRETF